MAHGRTLRSLGLGLLAAIAMAMTPSAAFAQDSYSLDLEPSEQRLIQASADLLDFAGIASEADPARVSPVAELAIVRQTTGLSGVVRAGELSPSSYGLTQHAPFVGDPPRFYMLC